MVDLFLSTGSHWLGVRMTVLDGAIVFGLSEPGANDGTVNVCTTGKDQPAVCTVPTHQDVLLWVLPSADFRLLCSWWLKLSDLRLPSLP
mmetsp:Transcript_154935/g.274718  ORF Transcript_154935/g.274718 Transcript_154935/m.274718 type:complete len:89 (-) Transcript_154935:230-496(-)